MNRSTTHSAFAFDVRWSPRRVFGKTLAMSAAAASLVLLAGLTPASATAEAHVQDSVDEQASASEDVLVLKNGRQIRGEILEETDTQVKINMRFGSFRQVTTYEKSEILQIRRGVSMPAEGETEGSGSDVNDPDFSGLGTDKTPDLPEDVNEDTTIIYPVTLSGQLQFDVTPTPMRDIFADADRVFDDLVEVPASGGGTKMVVREDKRDKHIVLFKLDGLQTQPVFDGYRFAESLVPIIKEEKRKGRRIVFWVEEAIGGGAVLPLVAEEIYWTTDGIAGGVGGLDEFDIGEDVVDEKQISLRLGHVEGIALEGGYGQVGVDIVRAMARDQFWLFARMIGGKPQTLLEVPDEGDGGGWFMLSDDADGDNEDPEEALRGNDGLTLEADWALRLGVAKDIADTIEDIAYSMRVFRNYHVLDDDVTRADEILADWKAAIRQWAEKAFPGNQQQRPGELWREYAEIEVAGDFKDRTRARGQRIRLLEQIMSLTKRYAEAVDPGGNLVAQLETMINEIKLEQENDRLRQNRSNYDRNRGGGGRGGGRGGGGIGG
jgi:hypothetical protein